MERILDFSDVTRYDFSLMGSDMILKLFQGDVVTKIHIETEKAIPIVSNKIETQCATVEKPKVISALVESKEQNNVVKRRRVPIGRLNESQVREIRGNWDATVKACGTKNAAADQLAKVYNCSAKNIYAIIYRYSWANV
jgi:hypothetical protein